MSQREEKIYVPGTFGNVFEFQDGGCVYNIDIIDLKAFSDFVKKYKTSDDKLRLQIQKQKNDPKKLSVSLNTFQPKPKEEEEDSLF